MIEHFTDGNGDGADLYLRKSGPATLVTTSGVAADHGANAPVGEATLTNDRVFFSSKATDLNGDYTVTGEQVWMSTGTGPATLVTRGLQLNHGANGDSTLVAASTHVLVRSTATDLSAPLKQHDGTPTLYRIDTATFDAEPVSARGDDSNDAAPDAGGDQRRRQHDRLEHPGDQPDRRLHRRQRPRRRRRVRLDRAQARGAGPALPHGRDQDPGQERALPPGQARPGRLRVRRRGPVRPRELRGHGARRARR